MKTFALIIATIVALCLTAVVSAAFRHAVAPLSQLNVNAVVLLVERGVADRLRSRPDFVSAEPTYGPEGLWTVVLGGNP